MPGRLNASVCIRQALWEYYKAHRAEVVRLRHRAAERSLGSSDSGSRDRVAAALAKALERAQQQALQLQSKSTGTEDLSFWKLQQTCHIKRQPSERMLPC